MKTWVFSPLLSPCFCFYYHPSWYNSLSGKSGEQWPLVAWITEESDSSQRPCLFHFYHVSNEDMIGIGKKNWNKFNEKSILLLLPRENPDVKHEILDGIIRDSLIKILKQFLQLSFFCRVLFLLSFPHFSPVRNRTWCLILPLSICFVRFIFKTDPNYWKGVRKEPVGTFYFC